MKARYLNPEGTMVEVDHENGKVEAFPTTENAHKPWIELRAAVAQGRMIIEPYQEQKPLTKAQLKKLGLS